VTFRAVDLFQCNMKNVAQNILGQSSTPAAMKKAIRSLMYDSLNALKWPILSILMIFVVITLWRRPPGKLRRPT
jgi:hypothetical protein